MGAVERAKSAAPLRERYPELITYSTEEVAGLTGFSVQEVLAAQKAGTLVGCVPAGKQRGLRFRLLRVAQWLDALEGEPDEDDGVATLRVVG